MVIEVKRKLTQSVRGGAQPLPILRRELVPLRPLRVHSRKLPHGPLKERDLPHLMTEHDDGF